MSASQLIEVAEAPAPEGARGRARVFRDDLRRVQLIDMGKPRRRKPSAFLTLLGVLAVFALAGGAALIQTWGAR